MKLLADNDLGPEIIAVTDDWIDIRKFKTLREWLDQSSQSEISQMGYKILRAVQKMHSLGFCHRDLHRDNLLVDDDGEPLIIDPEHSCSSDSKGKCYDLYGPSDSVPLLPAHIHFGGVIGSTGIWWDAEHDPRYDPVSLGTIFGSIEKIYKDRVSISEV